MPKSRRTLIFRTTIAAACTALGWAWLQVTGPFPVIRITTALPIMAPDWYMLSAFPILGLLVAELVLLFREDGLSLAPLELMLQMMLLISLGHVRLLHRIPVSGHALLFSYFILRRILLGPARLMTTVELGLAIAALLATSYAKIVMWNDPFTVATGILVATVLAAISRWSASRFGTARARARVGV